MSRSLLILLALLGGCDEGPAGNAPVLANVPAPSSEFHPPAGLEKVRIGITPHLEAETLRKAHQGLLDYLSKGLGVPVVLEVAQSYDDLGERIARGEFDVAVFSPYAFARAQRGRRLIPIVSVLSEGSASAGGYILVRSDSPVRTLEELHGKRFAFVDRASTSGYLYPAKLLLDRGLVPQRFFGSIEFLGNHEAALLAVHEGRADGAATYHGALVSLQRNRGIDPLSFRIIAKTPRTPRDIFAAREALDPQVITRLRELLLALSARTPGGRKLLRPLDFNGFVVPQEEPYAALLSVEAAVEKR